MKTGVQGTYNWWKELDSGFRRNDGKTHFLTFYEFINFDPHRIHLAEGELRLNLAQLPPPRSIL